jgi:hypothetical protein
MKKINDKPAKSIEELRDSLATVFEQVKKGEIEYKTASALSNIADKIISSARLQMEYQIACREVPSIQFMESK